jgi:hypothetical protein
MVFRDGSEAVHRKGTCGMKKLSIITVPRIAILVADKNLARCCPRCQKSINEGESYLKHSEGEIHYACLRTGKTKEFIGRPVSCEPR